MFNWLGEFVEWISLFVPRLVIVRTTHRVVKFIRGKKLVLVEPGLCVYWPVVTEIVTIATARQPTNLPTQRLTTKDDRRVICSAVVVYNIPDPVQAVGKNWDYEATLRDVSMCAVATIVTSTDYDTLVKTLSGELRVRLTNACRQELQKYGVRVQNCMLTDFCRASVIALSNSDASPEYEL